MDYDPASASNVKTGWPASGGSHDVQVERTQDIWGLAAITMVAGLVTPPVAASEDSIRRLLAEQTAAWNAGDAEAWSKDIATDADFINILGMHYQGREAAERRHAELFATIFKGSQVEMTALKIRMLGKSTAIAETVLDLRDFSRLPPGIRATVDNAVLRTRMSYVLVRERDQWRIVLAQNTAVMPLPPAN